MPSIKRVTVEGFRGISRRVTLTLDGKCLVLFGENGTGKSSFVDAIERVLTGRVSTLDGRAQALSSTRHGPNIRGPAPQIEIEFDQGFVLNINSPDSLPPGLRAYVQGAREPLFILRRRQILDFIEARPADRYSLLRPFLPLAEVDGIEAQFRSASETSARALVEVRRSLQAVVKDLARVLGISDRAIPFEERDLVIQINARLSRRGRPAISALSELDSVVIQLEETLAKFGDTAAHLALHAAHRQLQEIRDAVDIQSLYQLLDRSRELRRHEAALGRLFFEEVLERGLQWIQEGKLGACPLCEQGIEPKTTSARIRERLAEMQHLIALRREVEGLQGQAQSTLQVLAQKASAAERQLREAGQMHEAVVVAGLVAWVRTAISIVIQRPLEPDRVATAVGGWEESRFPQSVHAAAQTLEERVRELPSLELMQGFLDLRDYVQRVQRLWGQQEVARAKETASAQAAQVVQKILEHLRAARKEEVQAIFDKISNDVDVLYTRLHPDESHGGIHLDVREVGAGSVNVRARFYDREDEDPRAYYSDAHLDTLGLSVFLALRRWHRSLFPDLGLLVLDDVLTSVDADHRVRVAEMLVREFATYQLFVTTHDRIWFEHFRDIQLGCRVSERFVNKIIHKWTIEEGPDLREPQDERATLGWLMDEGGAQQIASEAGRLLEHILQEMRYNLQLAVQAKRGERYELGELWPPFRSTIIKRYPGFYERTKVSVDALDVRWPLRNWVGAHFNAWAQGVPRREAIEFGKAVASLFDALFCGECRRFIEPSVAPADQLACRCGHLIYPPPGKEARPPVSREELVGMTSGTLRGSRLTLEQYLEWKRGEIRGEES